MSVELLPLGTRCSLSCRFCYQQPIRDAGNQAGADYDMATMKRSLAEENYAFTVFGGEPLLLPIDDLEELWRWGMERYGRNGIQTSATLVTERHFELFRKYNVFVGISLEGPGDLNDIRWAGSLERTREATARAHQVLHRLLEEKYPVSLITTLHRGNAAPGPLPRLLDWYRELDSRTLRHVNLHLMEIDSEKVRAEWSLSEEENAAALLACAELQSEIEQVRFQPIIDMVALLLGQDGDTNCIWNACDPYTTRAVRGVNGHGERVNCSRTNKAGVIAQKADRELLVRPVALYHAPQERGGCAGCRFWFACKGSCSGEALGGDWRQKTEHCGTLQRVFGALERRLATLGFRPISLDRPKLKELEKALLEAFSGASPLRICDILKDPAARSSSACAGQPNRPHGDRPHGDHEDVVNPVYLHSDHTDNG